MLALQHQDKVEFTKKRKLLGREWLGCFAGHQEVSRCHIIGESQGMCNTYIPLPSANKAAHSGFETQRRCHQKSKIGVSEAHKRTCALQSFYKKRRETKKISSDIHLTCEILY